ncbi:hypothetical protein GCM10027445_21190 [Amycolatopsis endophytica]
MTTRGLDENDHDGFRKTCTSSAEGRRVRRTGSEPESGQHARIRRNSGAIRERTDTTSALPVPGLKGEFMESFPSRSGVDLAVFPTPHRPGSVVAVPRRSRVTGAGSAAAFSTGQGEAHRGI